MSSFVTAWTRSMSSTMEHCWSMALWTIPIILYRSTVLLTSGAVTCFCHNLRLLLFPVSLFAHCHVCHHYEMEVNMSVMNINHVVCMCARCVCAKRFIPYMYCVRSPRLVLCIPIFI